MAGAPHRNLRESHVAWQQRRPALDHVVGIALRAQAEHRVAVGFRFGFGVKEIRALTKSCQAEAGFTLLELLIATTVLGFLSLLLFGGLQFGTRVWEKAQSSTTDTNRVRAAQLFLSDEISHIYPSFAGLLPADKHVQFEGQDKRMTFLAASKSVAGAMDWVTIQAQPGNGSVSVVVTSEDELSNGHATALRLTLIPGLKWFQ